jgi:hypothetical protein
MYFAKKLGKNRVVVYGEEKLRGIAGGGAG